MKIYLIKESDINNLLLKIDRGPLHGQDGGSSQASVRDKQKDIIYNEVHRFYNYQVRTWIDSIKKE